MLNFYQNSSEKLLQELLSQKNKVIYAGFDATAESLHVGNLSLIMTLKKLQEKCNHLIIIIVGGATTRIGDPTDKTSARKVLSEETIQKNIQGIKKSLAKFLTFAKESTVQLDKNKKCTNLDNLYGKAILLDNHDWWKNVNYVEFITRYGKFFSINNMISIEIVKRRLQNQQHLSLLEFNYMVMQGYDFLYLYEKFNCTVQIGGSDQWGNIIQGIKLIQNVHKTESLALTIPLITNSAGEKMGKTGNHTVWLNEEKLSPYEYYQYWININDNDIQKMQDTYTMIKRDISTDTPKQSANQLLTRQELAFELTKLCHGDEKAQQAIKMTQEIFDKNQNTTDQAPTIEIQHNTEEIHVYELLIKTNIAQSKSEAKRLIDNKGIKINKELCSHNTTISTKQNVFLSKGKKTHILCKFA